MMSLTNIKNHTQDFFGASWEQFLRIIHMIDRGVDRGWEWYVLLVTNGIPSNEIAMVITSLFILMLSCFTLAGMMVWRKPLIFLDRILFLREVGFSALLLLTFINFYFRWSNLFVRIGIYVFLAVVGFTLIAALVRENTMSSREVEEERRRQWEDQRTTTRKTEVQRRGDWDREDWRETEHGN